MNARSNLITVMLTLSLLGPSAASAYHLNIPGDASLPKKQPAVHLHTLKANASTSGLSASGNWAAYVRGGSSQKVAKAITAAATTRSANSSTSGNYAAYVRGGSSQKVAKAITAAATTRAANSSTSGNWAAYVRGGSSQKVAKAITAAATTRTASTCASDSQRRVAC